jgi:CubicO group peptidase (beta-lactamase class C family)
VWILRTERGKEMLDKIAEAPIGGTVAPGFEEVEAEFRRNFREQDELGAACAVYYRGEQVVDLWGGYRDLEQRLPWQEDTLVLVYSTTKGLAGMTVAVAHSRGLLDYDEKVATYWPEFAQGGKENITVRQLLSHQAGLSGLDKPLNLKTIADLDSLAATIARQKPAWEPGTRHGYHGISLGWYEGELIRRVDPRHRSLGQFFHEEIAMPLGLEFYIGLPSTVPASRIAEIKAYRPVRMLLHMNTMPAGMVLALMNPRSLTSRSLNQIKDKGIRGPADLNKPEIWALEMPALGGVGQVRSIAKAYGEFAIGGRKLGITEETLDALTKPAAPPSQGIRDMVLHVDTSFSLGFIKPFPNFSFGSSEKAYGTPGFGISFGFADPDAQVGFAYAPNRMGFHNWDDPREKALRDALIRCLRAQG